MSFVRVEQASMPEGVRESPKAICPKEDEQHPDIPEIPGASLGVTIP